MRGGSPATTNLVGGFCLFLVAAAGGLLAIGPEFTALSDARTAMVETQDRNSVLASQLASLEKQSKRLGETRRTALDLEAKFPSTADQPGLFDAVTASALGAGIGADDLISVAPAAPQIAGTDPVTGLPVEGSAALLARQTVSVSISGTFEETQRFLENLEQMTRAYLVTSVTFAGGEDADSYATTVSGTMFVMPPVPDPMKSTDNTMTLGG